MKIYCEKCHDDISNIVNKNFDAYDVGNIECPHCKTKQKRYISETDLLIYFLFSSTFYCIALLMISFIFTMLDVSLKALVAIIIVFVFSYIILRELARKVYKNAYFKKEVMNKRFKEKSEEVGKRMRWQFIAFMVLGIMMSSQIELFFMYLILLLIFDIVTAIKIYFSLKREKS